MNGNAAEPLRLYVPGEGGLYASAWTSDELDWGRGVAWADFDRDGDYDLAVGNGFGDRSHNRIYRNDGDGRFSLIWTAANAALTYSVRWADTDHDGDLDLVASIDHGVRIYRNAAGTFSEVDAVDTSFDDVFGIDVADIDNDGDVDLAVATSSGPAVYINNGTGIYSRLWQGPAEEAQSVRWGDYDGDSDADLAVGFSYGLQIFQQTGGSFVRVFHSGSDLNPGVTARTGQLEWLDFDGDGDLDLVAAHCQLPASGACMPAANRVYKNTGGTFSVGWTASELDLSQGVAVADFNDDGKPDLAFGNNGPNRIYRNLGGSFVLEWTSPESENTNAVAWAPLAGP
ncbi:MAG TPA: VCBS repeat-containing protein [Kofleriaceae bacterium]|nr:VCBS repeat-containing protein [Kofleriaceae bacterium]